MGKLTIISVDGHVANSRPGYREYVDHKHLDAYDEWAQALDALGIPILGNLNPEFDPSSQWASQQRLRDLEGQGVLGEVLFPNGMPFQVIPFADAVAAPDPELARQARVVYNRWLADFCADAPGRRAGQAVVSFKDVDQAVADIYWAKEHGLAGVMMPALVPGERFFFDPELDPIWAACEELALPISQHGGTGAPSYSPAGYASIMTLALEHSFFSGRSLWQLIYGGVFDRFPDLKVVFVETETDWIGRMIQKMDRRLALGDDWLLFSRYLGREKPFSRTASEYWASNCYAGLSPFNVTSEASIGEVIGQPGTTTDGTFCFGTDRCMFGVDYPHFESIVPNTRHAVADLLRAPEVTDSDARKVLYENAARIYGFDLFSLESDVDRIGFSKAEILGAMAS